MEKAINEVFDDYQSSVPFSIITRSDSIKAQRDERLMRSDKGFMKEYIEDRAKRLLVKNEPRG